MALTTGHRILTWGYNGSGQLGDGTDNSSTVPVFAALPGGFEATSIGGGFAASTGLAIGTVPPA